MKKTIAILSLLPLIVMLSGCGLNEGDTPTSPLSGGENGIGGSTAVVVGGGEVEDCSACSDLDGTWCEVDGDSYVEFDTQTCSGYWSDGYDGDSFTFTCTGSSVTLNWNEGGSDTGSWSYSGGILYFDGSVAYGPCGY